MVNPESCDFRDSTTYELTDRQTVEDLMECADIAKKDVKIIFVNSRIVDANTILSDGDKVGFAPATGGM